MRLRLIAAGVRQRKTELALGAAACVLFGAILATACSSWHANPTAEPSGTPPAVPATGVSTAPVRPSLGCSNPNRSGSGAATETIAVQGAQRTYRRYLPERSEGRPMPVVINLHGLAGNIDQQAALSAFEAVAARETFIVLTPQAAGTPPDWNLTESVANVDVQFIIAMLDTTEATACVDTSRVYATGISHGGIMSSVLACIIGDRIAAVGLVSGIRRSGDCHPSRAIPVVIFWGKQDGVLPYCGGLGNIVSALLTNEPIPTASAPICPPDNLYGFPPVEQVVDNWATADGCDLNPNVVQVAIDVEERDFGGCAQSGAVRFFVVTGGGHTWPGSKVMEAMSNTAAGAIIGFTTDAIDATQLIWGFFQAHALTDGTS